MHPHQVLSSSLDPHPGLTSRSLFPESVTPVPTSFQASSSKFSAVGCCHLEVPPASQIQQVQNSSLSAPIHHLLFLLMTFSYSLSLGLENFGHFCSHLHSSIYSVANTCYFFLWASVTPYSSYFLPALYVWPLSRLLKALSRLSSASFPLMKSSLISQSEIIP